MTEQTAESFDVLMDAIHAEATGKEIAVVEAPEPKEEVVEEPIVENTDDVVDEPKEEEEEIEAAKPEKPRSKHVPRERFDSANAKAKAAEDRAEQLERDVAALRELVKKDLAPKAPKEEAPEFLDPEAQAYTDKKLEAMEQKIVAQGFKQAITLGFENQDFKTGADKVIADDAFNIIKEARAVGDHITKDEAIEMAEKQFISTMYNLHQRNKNMASYVFSRAKDVDALLKQGTQGNEEKPAAKKSTVNMKELQELRDSAGAPTNKSVSSEVVANDFDSMMAKVRKESIAARSY